MYIIYHDVGGSHSAVIASHIHLNNLPADRIPATEEILATPMFDKLESKNIGRLIFHGTDEYGNSIYTLARLYYKHTVTNAIESIPEMLGIDKNKVLLVDTSPSVNFLMKLGGGSSRKLRFVSFGRPIVAYGTIKAYENILDLVNKTKTKIAPN